MKKSNSGISNPNPKPKAKHSHRPKKLGTSRSAVQRQAPSGDVEISDDIGRKAFDLAAAFLESKLQDGYASLDDKDRKALEEFLQDIASCATYGEFQEDKDGFLWLVKGQERSSRIIIEYAGENGGAPVVHSMSPKAAVLAIDLAQHLENSYKTLLKTPREMRL